MKSTQIAQARLANQLLGKRKGKDSRQVVAWLGAVQSQDFAAATWALGLRTDGTTRTDIERAFNKGKILRTHVMRPTWHFVAPQDIRSVLTLTAARVQRSNARRYRDLELDQRLLSRCHAIFTKVLRGKTYLTRAELAKQLQQHRIMTMGQRLAYILMHAELEALICSGPVRGRQFTYALLDERAPRGKVVNFDDALRRWALRYFVSHGPAQLRDFVWWSGLEKKDAQRGLDLARAQLSHERIDGKIYWFSPSARADTPKTPTALLLSIYDEFVIAYRDRSAIAADRSVENLLSMGNALTSVLIVDGELAGTWKRVLKPDRVEITANPFRHLNPDECDAVQAAVVRYGAFLEKPSFIVP